MCLGIWILKPEIKPLYISQLLDEKDMAEIRRGAASLTHYVLIVMFQLKIEKLEVRVYVGAKRGGGLYMCVVWV